MSWILDSSEFLIGAKAFSSFALLVSIFAVLTSVTKSYMALRAKHRARIALAEHKFLASELGAIIATNVGKIPAEDIEKILLQLKADGSNLTSKDIEFIERGLEQPSKSGARRYAKDILGAA